MKQEDILLIALVLLVLIALLDFCFGGDGTD